MGRYSVTRKVLFNDWVNEGSQAYAPILSTITVIIWNRGPVIKAVVQSSSNTTIDKSCVPYYADVDSVYSKMVLGAFL